MVIPYLKGFGMTESSVARPRTSPTGERKPKLTISPDPELLEWVRARTGPGKRFASVTHAVECGWVLLRDADRKR